MKKENKSNEDDFYIIKDGNLEAGVTIDKKPGEHILTYSIEIPRLSEASSLLIDDIKAELIRKIPISSQEVLNIKMAEDLKKKFFEHSVKLLNEKVPHLSEDKTSKIARRVVQEMLGLGDIEFLLKDDWIEEVCINGANYPVWVYHRKFGWIKTNVKLESDNQVWNYSSSIGRGVGRQINTQTPLLDAYLSTGDRVNATLFPISYFGNTITIRKFARKPWTITDYMKMKTITPEVAALLWLAIQYEMNIIVSGGTGAGKTSLLNVLSIFVPQNQRVVSIEQTREITLPSYLQWVPMVVREATSEGKGAISMLDLMVNSLRMRPDRVIVGEIRREEEAQVLFEAMHTGHSVYATLHAETVSETIRRLVNPPINIPSVMMESLQLIVAMYRDRRSNIRRIYEVGEVVPSDKEGIKTNILYRWRPYKDELSQSEKSIRLMQNIKMHSNMDDQQIQQDLKEKEEILEWMLKKNINTIEEVGAIISAYYDEPASVLKMVRKQ
jgi:flagellar protein FlaI